MAAKVVVSSLCAVCSKPVELHLNEESGEYEETHDVTHKTTMKVTVTKIVEH